MGGSWYCQQFSSESEWGEGASTQPIVASAQHRFTQNNDIRFYLPLEALVFDIFRKHHQSGRRSCCQALKSLNYWSEQLTNMPLERNMKGGGEKYSREIWDNEMRIWGRTKWGFGGGYKCPAAAALGEYGNSALGSGQVKIRRNSISTHPALSIAKWLC